MSPSPCALKGLSDFAARNPGPGRCSDEHFLVKPFSRVLVRGISPRPCACCASAPSQPQSLLIRGVSPNPCGAQVAFRLCWCKVPRPRRSADADFLVKPFCGVLVRGISPNPCACCASALSQPRHFVTAPFRGKPAWRCLRRASPLLRCLRHLAAPPPRRLCGPSGSRFPTLQKSAQFQLQSRVSLMLWRSNPSDSAESGETRLCPDKRQILPPRHGHSHDTRAVADNIVVQSKLKVLPVPICGQVKPLSACLSVSYLPPPDGLAVSSNSLVTRGMPTLLRAVITAGM